MVNNKKDDKDIPSEKQKMVSGDRFRSSNLVIGLTGPFGSGCGGMRKVLEGKGFHPFKISDDIRDELRTKKKLVRKGDIDWRKVLQDHGNKQRKKDAGYWVKKVLNKIIALNIGDKNIVIDGFRNFQEVQEIRKIYPRFFLVAVCADKDERWKRVQNDYQGRYKEFDRDDRRDRNEDFEWGQKVQKCVDDADYVYYNNEHLVVIQQQEKEAPNVNKIERTLKKAVDDFVPLMEGIEDSRSPVSEEIQMAAAYAQANSSTCMKRHVGAVITMKQDHREYPISMGFNENPACVKTCSEEGGCYKDEDMASKLNALKDIYCLVCGKKYKSLKAPWACSCGASFQEWLHRTRNMELCTAIHAEERAILSLGSRSAKGGTLYVTTFPCFQCARMILDKHIGRIVFVEAYPTAETTGFLKKSGVTVQPFSGFTARAFFRVFPKK
jgi:deoxycytidylate deaminase